MSDHDSPLRRVAALTIVFALSISARADVFNMPTGQTSLQMVSVGNAANPNDPATGNVRGGVAYNYSIGKFEITIGQYTQFLNAVAKSDTYELYHGGMAIFSNAAGISQSGSSGHLIYNPIGSPNRPIAFVNWGDAARFCNWLSNGQPTGGQGPGTTETGSYTLNGAITDAALNAVVRNLTAKYVIPTESEWYKAAFYDPTRAGSHYWFYPMRTDAVPYSDQPPGTTSPNQALVANFKMDDGLANGYNDGYAVTGSSVYSSTQNYLTDVGAYTFVQSYYGTFDQGGNVSEWNEKFYSDFAYRGLSGSSWGANEVGLRSTYVLLASPTYADVYAGFRIALVPEPATLVLLSIDSVLLLRRPRAHSMTDDDRLT